MSKPRGMLYQNIQHTRVMNLKFKSKLKKLKQQIKNIIFENAALCDEVAQVQADLAIAREERRFLIKRLIRHEGLESLEEQQQPQIEIDDDATQLLNAVPKKRGPKKRQSNTNSISNTAANASSSGTGGENLEKICRTKPRDKLTLDGNGKPIFPINLGNMLIHSAGEIIPINPNFHAAHWIYPVGYVATRIYAHPNDPRRKCVFTCKILNNAGMPQFQIIPDNDLDNVFFGESANVCHRALLDAVSDVVQQPLQAQGEKFFGLGHPIVRTLLQMDPGYRQCAHFQGFNVGNNTAVITGRQENSSLTLADEKDPTINYDALQALIAMSVYHTLPAVKEAPPEELLEVS